MRCKLPAVIALCICVFCLAMGISARSSYTDHTKDPDFMMKLQVAELSDNLADEILEPMRDTLPDAAFILRVKATGEERHIFHLFMQKVQVEQIFQSEEDSPVKGQTIYVLDPSWGYFFGDKKSAEESMNYGFVNKMQAGKEYLIFLSNREDSSLDPGVDCDVYSLEEGVVDPIFCYEEIPNTVCPVSGESTYVPYRKVSGNEFFACTQKGLSRFLELKKEMIGKYS